MTRHPCNAYRVRNAVYFSDPGETRKKLNAPRKSSLVKALALRNLSNVSAMSGSGVVFLTVSALRAR